MPRLLLPVLLSLAVPPVSAQEADRPTPDPLVERHLEQLNYNYEVDEDGDYKLVFELDGGRSQLVYVRSPVEEFGTHRVREIWSPGYRSDTEQFSAKVANRLLEATQDNKLGAWAKQGHFAVFVVKLPSDASAQALEDAIDAAVRSADEMENELTPGKDDL